MASGSRTFTNNRNQSKKTNPPPKKENVKVVYKDKIVEKLVYVYCSKFHKNLTCSVGNTGIHSIDLGALIPRNIKTVRGVSLKVRPIPKLVLSGSDSKECYNGVSCMIISGKAIEGGSQVDDVMADMLSCKSHLKVTYPVVEKELSFLKLPQRDVVDLSKNPEMYLNIVSKVIKGDNVAGNVVEFMFDFEIKYEESSSDNSQFN